MQTKHASDACLRAFKNKYSVHSYELNENDRTMTDKTILALLARSQHRLNPGVWTVEQVDTDLEFWTHHMVLQYVATHLDEEMREAGPQAVGRLASDEQFDGFFFSDIIGVNSWCKRNQCDLRFQEFLENIAHNVIANQAIARSMLDGTRRRRPPLPRPVQTNPRPRQSSPNDCCCF